MSSSRRMAKKYRVGKIARKHILSAIELVMQEGDVDSVVYRPPSTDRYEIRVTHLAHGLEIKWAEPGTFFNPEVTG